MLKNTTQCPRLGARFSKTPQAIRAGKAICSKSVSKNRAVYSPEKCCMKGTFGYTKSMQIELRLCHGFPGSKILQGLREASARARTGNERTNMRQSGLHYISTLFNNVRFRNQVTQMNPRCFTV